MQTNVATRLLLRFAQGSEVHQPTIDGFGVPAGLQPASKLDVMQECDLVGLGIHQQSARCQMRLRLISRKRLVQPRQQLSDLLETTLFVGILGSMRIQQCQQ